MPLVEKELPTLPEHLSSPPVLVGFLLLNLSICARVMVYNVTLNNSSAISLWSVLLMDPQATDKLYHTIEYTSPWAVFKLTNLVAIGTDSTCSCKSTYHTIMTTTVARCFKRYNWLERIENENRQRRKIKNKYLQQAWCSHFSNSQFPFHQ